MISTSVSARIGICLAGSAMDLPDRGEELAGLAGAIDAELVG
jgi:hypothetical protein